ncbi:MAG TPA: ATPase, T2SS/T4P/T4SS family [Candidatus Baltobacteraceae bacterium]|jgi:septum site-determining protein MinD|nr:ATPase, T2SS/T4P/T4SS family [Candidatus Baltobacteraceae bacterium]
MSAPVFAFVNAKGGSGATTVCAELAKAMRADGKVAVVDGDLSGKRNLAIVFDVVRGLDISRAGKGIGVAETNGLTIAELAPTYDTAFTINFDDVEQLAASFSDASFVLADVPMPFAAPVRPFVVRATRFIVVCEPTLLGVASARTMIAELKNFGVPITRIVVLTNNRDGHANATRAEIERALETKVLAELPPASDRNFGKALAQLDRAIRIITEEPQIEALLPSARGLVQDRRLEPRSAMRPRSGGPADTVTIASGDSRRGAEPVDPREKLKLEIHELLTSKVNLIEASAAHSDTAKLAELRQKIEDATQQVLSDRAHSDLTAEDISQIKEEIVNESLGLGPLEDLMRDPAVSEIMVNGPKTVYIERSGKLELTGKRFSTAGQLRLVIERIIAPLGRRLDESVPMVDARLPDGSRVNAIIEPLAIDGASLTIRRFGTRRLNAQDLIDKGSANEEMLDFLRACIEARLNVVISGGTGSGKTTFLNIMSGYIPARERIVTIEDAAELNLNQPHVVRLETRPANLEGAGEIKIRDLVRNSLRMRPDRIVVGECRGGEALDMLQAMNTGHDGSLTTLHANSPRDALSRLETLVMMAGFDLPVRAIREQIASAVDLIVQIARLRDGSRKIVSVSEIIGMEGEVVTMQEILRYAQHGVDLENKVAGEFQYTGVQPQALQKFDEYGITYDVRKLSQLSSAGSLW